MTFIVLFGYCLNNWSGGYIIKFGYKKEKKVYASEAQDVFLTLDSAERVPFSAIDSRWRAGGTQT